MKPWRDAWVWESVAEEIGDYRRRGYGALVTGDVLRFAVARAIGEAGSGPASLRLDRPHPSLPGSCVNLAIGEPPEAVIEFNYPCEPNETSIDWTQVFGEILKDFYRLAVHPGDVDRIYVLALTPSLRTSLASSAGRYGVDLDSDRVSLSTKAAVALPRSSAGVMGDDLRYEHVNSSRLSVINVDEDLRISVFVVDPVAEPSNSLMALALAPQSDAPLLPPSASMSRAAAGIPTVPSNAQATIQSSERLPAGSQHEQGQGDADYLRQLPASLRSLGHEFLREVRRSWPGDLRPTPAGRFVETPDNFWTVKIQPRDVSLRVTVRGEPERFGAQAELGLKRDRAGYSTFKIRKGSDIPLAIAVLGKVSRR